MTPESHESPCPCSKRRTRVVFPGKHAARVWAMIAAAAVSWIIWVSKEVTKISVSQPACKAEIKGENK